MNMKLGYSDIKFKDNGKLKLLIIVGTRPEIIRLAAVINKCRQYFDTILAHTGQNYDYNLNSLIPKYIWMRWVTTSVRLSAISSTAHIS